jgi:hypothetical protein
VRCQKLCIRDVPAWIPFFNKTLEQIQANNLGKRRGPDFIDTVPPRREFLTLVSNSRGFCCIVSATSVIRKFDYIVNKYYTVCTLRVYSLPILRGSSGLGCKNKNNKPCKTDPILKTGLQSSLRMFKQIFP